MLVTDYFSTHGCLFGSLSFVVGAFDELAAAAAAAASRALLLKKLDIGVTKRGL